MRSVMPQPVLRGAVYHFRLHVPRDVEPKANGTYIAVPVGDALPRIKITTHAKGSLRTKDRSEARRRQSEVLATLEAYWEQLRSGPRSLTHKEAVALAGEVRRDFVRIFDEDPGDADTWQRVSRWDDSSREGRSSSLMIPTTKSKSGDIEGRFGGLADAALSRHGLAVDDSSRHRVVQQIAEAMRDVPAINSAKALGDYSDSGETDRFPVFDPKPQSAASKKPTTAGPTFASVIEEEAENRKRGREGRPMPERSRAKYEKAVADFAAFRESNDVSTVTTREADGWKRQMLDAEAMSNSTIAQRLQNVRTVVGWAKKQSLGELFPGHNPFSDITMPERNPVASDERTIQPSEAKQILRASRKQHDPERRWLPWLCAYSGARINEVAQLQPENFFQSDGSWFFEVTTKGGKSLKNEASKRIIPVHSALVEEGLIDFAKADHKRPGSRMFGKDSAKKVRDWVRNKLQLDREEMAPNHGWRHLFEDLAMAAGVSDSAKAYITGRSLGRSSEGYGKSNVMLPGLAREMEKIPPFLL